MKKFIVLILCLTSLNLPTLAVEIIKDALVENTIEGKTYQIQQPTEQIIEDNFVNSTLDKKNHPKTFAQKPIIDDFSEKTLQTDKYQISLQAIQPIQDEFASKKLKHPPVTKAEKKLDYNFEIIKKTPVNISINSDITTKNDIKEGQELEFKVLKDVRLNKEMTLRKGTIVTARLETISPNQAFGVPADIVIDNFSVKRPNQVDLALDGSIHKTGANRSLWVYPVGYIGTCLFLVGFLVFPIRGGHAKIKTKDIYEVYYIPEV